MLGENFITQVTDTLSRRPEYGIVSSIFTIGMSTTELLQIIGLIIGLFIAIVTAVLKTIELIDKVKEKRRLAHPDETPKKKRVYRKKKA